MYFHFCSPYMFASMLVPSQPVLQEPAPDSEEDVVPAHAAAAEED